MCFRTKHCLPCLERIGAGYVMPDFSCKVSLEATLGPPERPLQIFNPTELGDERGVSTLLLLNIQTPG
jgi:hypothetical protein